MRNTIALLLISIVTLFGACKKKTPAEIEKFKLSHGWFIHPADSTTLQGKTISSLNQSVEGWYEGSVPSTIMGVLTSNGLYDSLFIADNYKKESRIPFNTSWWYRKEFKFPSLGDNQSVFLNFNGISYYANIWLNGKQIASRDSIFGTYRRYTFDITKHIKEKNVLAVEVFKAEPGDPNVGFADWNPRPLDENMGIFRDITINVTNKVRLQNSYVQSKVNKESLDEAWLTVGTEVENLTNKKISGELVGRIDEIRFSYPLVLNPNEKKTIRLTSEQIRALHLDKPELWWCNNMGDPNLYKLNLSFRSNNVISDRDSVVFGVREVESYLTDKGDRGFKLNGKPVLIKSAGWTDDIFLRDNPARNETQVRYVKDMGLNMIRFENFWGNSSNIYDLCDQYGLLAMVGWSCQWEWEAYFGKPCSDEYGCIQSDADIDLIGRSFEDQVLWLRSHPCIVAWIPGSDMLQKPELETRYLNFLKQEDDRPYVGAAKKRHSPISGATGTKMAGPYEYVGPSYWYTDTIYGGAFGFNTETGIGAQLPVLESIKRFIPEDKLWPINKAWDYHCTSSTTAMNSLSELTKVMNAKYGKAENIEDYLMKADLINYDGTRAMFEAFRVNIEKTTGIVQWMLNSAWPSFYWQLYDYYMVPTAAYYSVKKANQPIQLIYNYGDKSVYAVNESQNDFSGYKAVIRIYDLESKLAFVEDVEVSVKNRTSIKLQELPVPHTNTFLSLDLYDEKGIFLSDNFYSLAIQSDDFLWDKTTWVYTPTKSYADYKKLEDLPTVKLEVRAEKILDKEKDIYTIILKNPSDTLAFFTNVKLKDEHGQMVAPVFWSDNYISILPQQEKELNVETNKQNVGNRSLHIEVRGWNIDPIDKKL